VATLILKKVILNFLKHNHDNF